MSFIGAVASAVRKVMAEYAKTVTLPCLVVGAGNFTVPSVLRSGGFAGSITACDVSLYTSALGAYLSGWELPVTEREDCPNHLKGLLRAGSPAELTASIALLLDLHEVWQAKNPYQIRLIAKYREAWDQLMAKTLDKLARFKEHVAPVAYQARDGFDLLESSGPEHTVFAFPPTYKGGYEKLESLLRAVCLWQPPAYREMTDKSLELYERIAGFNAYYVVLEKDLPDVYAILGDPVAVLPRGRDKCTYILARSAKKVVIRQQAKTASVSPIWPDNRPVTGAEAPGFAFLTRPQSLRLNELYLSKRIDYYEGPVDASVALTLDGVLIGKADFVRTSRGQWKLPTDETPLYIMCDLAVASCEKRLAKLVLLLMLSREVRELVEARLAARIGWLITTAFSAGPVSMKYRGVFTLYSRKLDKKKGEYALNYYAPFGERSLAENLALWKKKYAK